MAASWILIVSILSSDGVAASSVNGFQSMEACVRAGEAAVTQLKPVRYGWTKYVCVSTK